eukprot:gb/GEZN01003960.1/.p1 GENE.gb/GEZN01003960.1/~~gb/GEZN01003960.1/.p1  ORF type:complete len:498 (+),score=50.39 gb/GEZN01003960.1/:35-1528(+)
MTVLYSEKVGWQDPTSCKGAMKLLNMEFIFPQLERDTEKPTAVVTLAILATKRCLNTMVHDWAQVVSEGEMTLPPLPGKYGELLGELTVRIDPTALSPGKLRQNRGLISYRRPHFVLASPGVYTLTISSEHYVQDVTQVQPVQVTLHTNYHGRLLEPLEGVEAFSKIWDLDEDRRVTIDGTRIRRGHKRKPKMLVEDKNSLELPADERTNPQPEGTCGRQQIRVSPRRGARRDRWAKRKLQQEMREERPTGEAAAKKSALQPKPEAEFQPPKSPNTEEEPCEAKTSGELSEAKPTTNTSSLLSESSPPATCSPSPPIGAEPASTVSKTTDSAMDSRTQTAQSSSTSSTPQHAAFPGATEAPPTELNTPTAKNQKYSYSWSSLPLSPDQSPALKPAGDCTARSTSLGINVRLPALSLGCSSNGSDSTASIGSITRSMPSRTVTRGYSSNGNSTNSLFGHSLNWACSDSNGNGVPSQWLKFSPRAQAASILPPPCASEQ